MKNTYLTSYLPLFSILLFSLTFSVYGVEVFIDIFKKIGVYPGMREFLSDMQLKLALLVLLMVAFFMVFAALKLIGETINGVSMLFFASDSDGKLYNRVRSGSMIYFIGGLVSVVSLKSFLGMLLIFALSSIVYFIYFVYKISPSLSKMGLVGVVSLQVFSWSSLFITIFFVLLKLYNGVMASLPIISKVKL
ncbi:YufK family protein [Rossellomorea aquimaris]|nr:YufK family protein [Rossellomorea aquimaris]NMH68517.1 YufK family protein [Bacillus sp. RO3]